MLRISFDLNELDMAECPHVCMYVCMYVYSLTMTMHKIYDTSFYDKHIIKELRELLTRLSLVGNSIYKGKDIHGLY